MKSLLSRFLLLTITLAGAASQVSVVTANPVGVVCPKCGKVHAPTSHTPMSSSAVVSQASASMSAPSHSTGEGVSNVLSTLNAQRARQGIGQLGYDPTLQAVAERRAMQMARTGNKSHPPGSFSPGTYEGVGWSSSYSPSGVSACYTSDPRMRVAGAAMARGRDGVYFAVVYR